MSKITPRTTNTVENETQTMFVCVCDNHVGIILRDKETFNRLDFFQLDGCLKATALYIDDFDELLAFANNNDKGCIRSQIPPVPNTDNKIASNPSDGLEPVGVVASEGEALLSLTQRDFDLLDSVLAFCIAKNYHFADYQSKRGFVYESKFGLQCLVNKLNNIKGYYSKEHQDWLQACLDGSIDDDIPACFKEGA